MTTLAELQHELALSLLGENWEKNQEKKAHYVSPYQASIGDKPHPAAYHAHKAHHHQSLATFNKGAGMLAKDPHFHGDVLKKHNIEPKKAKRYTSQSVKHQALATAHEKLYRKYDAADKLAYDKAHP